MVASDTTTPPTRFAEVSHAGELTAAFAGLGLDSPVPVLVLVGGAANVQPTVAVALAGLFTDLAPRLDALGVTVIDGGTAFGVMALMGEARRAAGARFPLLGVAARGTVAGPGRRSASGPERGVPLDPNHTHVLLVPGAQWGDESCWISDAAAVLAGGGPSLTLVAAGGRVTGMDIAMSLEATRPLVTLAGSGGAADALAAWRRDGMPFGPAGADLDRGLVEVIDLFGPGPALVDLIGWRLAPRAVGTGLIQGQP